MDILSIDFLQTFGDLVVVQIEVNFAYDIFYINLRANNNESELRPIWEYLHKHQKWVSNHFNSKNERILAPLHP